MKPTITLFILLFSMNVFPQVGIGTTTPEGALDITSANSGVVVPRIALTSRSTAAPVTNPQAGPLLAGTLIWNTATNGTAPNNVTPGFYYWNGTSWIAITGSTGREWALAGNTGTTPGTDFVGTTDNVDLRIKTNGADRFNFSNNGRLRAYDNGTLNLPTYSWMGDEDTGMWRQGANVLSFSTNALERVRIPNAYQVHAMGLGTNALPFYSFSADPNTGIYSPGADQLSFSSNATERMRIHPSGISFFNTIVNQERFRFECDVLTGNATAMGIYNTGGNGSNQWSVHAYNSTADGGAILGYTTNTSNNNMAINGVNAGVNGIGVRGLHFGNTGFGAGVYGTSNSSDSDAVWGSIPTTGNWFGFGGYFTGGLGYANGLYNLSDERIKVNIETIPSALTKIKKIRGVSYNHDSTKYPYLFEGDRKKYLGFIAQEIKAVFPEAVTQKMITTKGPGSSFNSIGETEKELLNVVDYTQIIPVLVEAIKEQQQIIEDLKNRIESLEKR